MESLRDEELHYIFNKIPYEIRDTHSLIQVSKRFMKVSCVDLERFESFLPDMLIDILPSSPNLRCFDCCMPLLNTQLKILAHSCHKLEVLDLGLKLKLGMTLDLEPAYSEFEFDIDFNDDGLCALGDSCIHLRNVSLYKRLHVGDAGIVSLVASSKNLMNLNLEGCVRVTDESLKAIGESGIRNLNLRGCCLITDLGLEYLASGNLKNSLLNLNLSECDRITDNGVIHLNQMVGLTELILSKCGVHVTDSGIVVLISQLPNIEILDLSWLINVTDASVLAIGSKCLKLIKIYLTGCEAITVEGLRAFSGHETLETLKLISCYNFSWEDVESVALTCVRLQHLRLMKKIKTPMPEFNFDYLQIGHNTCLIGWDEDDDINLFF